MLDTIWDFFQLRESISPETQKNEANSATSKVVTKNSSSVARLTSQLDTLVLANQAMWEILVDRLDVTEEQLIKKMHEVDLRDGKLDGKIRKTELTQCEDCGHKVSANRAECYWCGSRLKYGSPFQG